MTKKEGMEWLATLTPPARPMSEHKAWLHLIKAISTTMLCFPDALRVRATDMLAGSYGLCSMLNDMDERAFISSSVFTRMIKKIEKFGPAPLFRLHPGGLSGYCWRLGDLRSRLAFCRRMAKMFRTQPSKKEKLRAIANSKASVAKSGRKAGRSRKKSAS